MTTTIEKVETGINTAENAVVWLLPILQMIPETAPFATLLVRTMPMVIAQTKEVEAALGHPVGSAENEAAIVAGIDPKSDVTLPGPNISSL